MRFGRAAQTVLAAALLTGAIAGCGGSGSSLTYTPPNEHGGWEYLGRDRDNTRYAPETQITASNVKHLGIAWRNTLGEDQYLLENFPIIVHNTIYTTTSTDVVESINAVTGHTNWTYAPEVNFGISTGVGGLGVSTNRGVAVHDGKIFLLTFDDRLQALSEKTGEELWSSRVAPISSGVFEDMSPNVYDGLVFVGGSGSQDGVRGFIAAYNEKTGKQVWRYYTIPKRGESWVCAKDCGGGAVFNAPTVDTKTGVIYFGTGSPAPVLIGAERPGPDLHTSSIMALEAKTGKVLWSYQEEKHDVLNYAPEQPTMIINTKVNGKEVEAVAEAGKDGYLYVLNAKTGKLLFERTAVVPEEHEAPTEKGVVECPGPIGGVQFAPLAFDPQTSSVFVSGIKLCELVKVVPDLVNVRRNGSEGCFRGECDIGGIQTKPAGEQEAGNFTSVNVTNGHIEWQDNMPTPMLGGATATASNIVFTGDEHGELYAINAKNGDILWKGNLKLAFGTAPEVYTADGKEYVLAVIGGSAVTLGTHGGAVGAELVALRLGGSRVSGSTAP